MSFLDIFAWIVLVVLVASRSSSSFHGDAAGHVAQQAAIIPGRKRSRSAGWVTLFFGFVLWPVVLIWAYVDVPARSAEAAR